MQAISRSTSVSINTVTKLLVDAGHACAAYHDETVRNVQARRVQCDEIWSFVYAKAKQAPQAKADFAGDIWTWTALDADTKLIIAYALGDRSGATAHVFMSDLRQRLSNRVQLTTDGYSAYFEAVESAFGIDVDYAMLVKLYGGSTGTQGHERKYSPSECIGTRREVVAGDPDPDHICTSFVERHNLSMRMGMRRFTRLTNAFSKRVENHLHMLSLYFVHYNFCRMHKTLRMTPAMAAGLTTTLHDVDWLVSLVEGRTPKPGPRGPYRKKNSN